MADVIAGICAVCGKEIKKGKFGNTKIDGLLVCGFRCSGKLGKIKRKKEWSEEHWQELRDRQAEYDESALTIDTEEAKNKGMSELPEEALAILAGETPLAIVEGPLGFSKLRKKAIVTDTRIIIFDKKIKGSSNVQIPYAQLTGAKYKKSKMMPGELVITTQAGATKMDVAPDKHEIAKLFMETLKDKIAAIASVPLALSHNKGMMSESWEFYAPPQLAIMMAAKPAEQPKAESIPDQIKKLSELKDAGILTEDEFNTKKAELLAKM